jgi:hypothetical protein
VRQRLGAVRYRVRGTPMNAGGESMANHPQPGQAQPQPSDPWQDAPLWGGAADATGAPYGEPSVHFADPNSPPTGYPAAPAPVWGPPTPPAKKGLSTAAITLITAAAVIVVGGAVIGGYLYTQNSGSNSPQAHSSTSPTPHTTSASPSPTEQDFKTARIGQCLVNRGTTKDPDMHIADCAAGTYKVLYRYEGTVDEQLCHGKPSVTTAYHYGYGDTKLVYCLEKLD